MKGLAEVLAEHRETGATRRMTIAGCICGAWVEEAEWHDHVGTAVLDWVRERLAGAREDVERGLLAHVCSVSNLPKWMQVPATGRQMRPLTGPLADAALAAVAEALGVGEVRG